MSRISSFASLVLACFMAVLTFNSCDDEPNPAPCPPDTDLLGTPAKNNTYIVEDYHAQDIEIPIGYNKEGGGLYGNFEINPDNYPDEYYQWEAAEAYINNGATYYEDANYYAPVEKIGENEWRKGDYTFTKVIRDGVTYLRVHLLENTGYTVCNIEVHIEVLTKNESGSGTDYRWAYCIIQIKHYPQDTTKIRYKKHTYESAVSEDENGNMVYEDAQTAELMASLANRDDIETVVIGDMVYLFDSEDMKSDKKLRKLLRGEAPTRSEGTGNTGVGTYASEGSAFANMRDTDKGFAILFDDKYYTDTRFWGNFGSDYDLFLDVPDMENVGLNDKVSSLAVAYEGSSSDICFVLTVWEDKNYNYGDNDRTKHRISFIATSENRRTCVGNLKNVPCMHSSNSWNDRISSISMHYGNTGINLKDY